jgi:hypothetical protein
LSERAAEAQRYASTLLLWSFPMTLVNPWKKYRAWENRRWRKHVQWWERKRSKGRSHFILWAALVWGGLMILFTTASEYFLQHNFESWTLIIKVPIYLIGGYVVGSIGWSSNENKYQAFLRDASKDVRHAE